MELLKYSKPDEGEEGFRFVLLEDRGDRVLIGLIGNYPIMPTECVLKTDVVKIN